VRLSVSHIFSAELPLLKDVRYPGGSHIKSISLPFPLGLHTSSQSCLIKISAEKSNCVPNLQTSTHPSDHSCQHRLDWPQHGRGCAPILYAFLIATVTLLCMTVVTYILTLRNLSYHCRFARLWERGAHRSRPSDRVRPALRVESQHGVLMVPMEKVLRLWNGRAIKLSLTSSHTFTQHYLLPVDRCAGPFEQSGLVGR